MSEEEIIEDKIDESTMLKQIKNKLVEKNIPIETFIAEWERLETLEDDLTTVYMNGFYDGEKKWKDKIIQYKNAIETKISSIELDRDYGRYKRYGGKIKCEKYLAQLYGFKKALQDLLEENNK